MSNAPTDIPVNADGTYREPTWGEGGSFSVSGHEANGAGAGVLIGANDFNEPRRHLARWLRAYGITRSVPSDQGLYGSFLFPNSGGWNVSGGTLNGTLGSSWILVDADDDGGVVIQFNVPAGSPHVFTASRDTYVDLAEDGTATYTAVANGAPEPAVAASSVRVWKVVTDGTEITSATTVLPEIPVFKDIAANSLAISDTLAVGADLDVTGNLTVHGDTVLGDDAGDSVTITGAVDITGDTAIEGNTSVDGTFTVADNNAASFTGAVTLGNASVDAITVNGTTTFNTNVTVTGTAAGAALSASASGSASAGLSGTGQNAGSGVIGIGGATGAGVTGSGGATSGHGVEGTGANNAASYGVNGVAANTSAYGVRGTSAAAATTSAAGVRAEGLGDAPAMSALAASGNAARLESDTSSPARAPLVVVPQDADASTTQVGSIAVNSSRNNVIRHHNGSEYRSVHSSTKGHVFSAIMDSDFLNQVGTTGEICRNTITPEVVGNVVLTASVIWTPDLAADTLTVVIRDDTAGSNLVTRTIPAHSASEDHPVTITYIYTLPTAAAGREFVITLSTSSSGDLIQPVLRVDGVI